MTTPKHQWAAVTTAAPCEICGRNRYCSRNGTAARCTKLSSHPAYGEGIIKTDCAGNDWWLYNLGGSDRPVSKLPEPTVSQSHDETLADADTLNKVYSALLSTMYLTNEHRAQLKRRGLSLDQLRLFCDRLLYRSLPLRGRAKIVAKLITEGLETHFPHVPVACSPFSDPCVMRVSTALWGKEILDEEAEQTAYAGTDYQEVA